MSRRLLSTRRRDVDRKHLEDRERLAWRTLSLRTELVARGLALAFILLLSTMGRTDRSPTAVADIVRRTETEATPVRIHRLASPGSIPTSLTTGSVAATPPVCSTFSFSGALDEGGLSMGRGPAVADLARVRAGDVLWVECRNVATREPVGARLVIWDPNRPGDLLPDLGDPGP